MDDHVHFVAIPSQSHQTNSGNTIRLFFLILKTKEMIEIESTQDDVVVVSNVYQYTDAHTYNIAINRDKPIVPCSLREQMQLIHLYFYDSWTSFIYSSS